MYINYVYNLDRHGGSTLGAGREMGARALANSVASERFSDKKYVSFSGKFSFFVTFFF